MENTNGEIVGVKHAPVRIGIITIVKDDVVALETTLLSVVGQKKHSDLLVVVASGADGCFDSVIKQYGELIDMVLLNQDTGIANAFNLGTAVLSDVDYVCYLNAGDIFAGSDTLQRVRNLILSFDCPLGVFYGDWHLSRRGSGVSVKVSLDINIEKFVWNNPLNHQACFVPLSLAKAYKYDERLLLGMDYDLWLRLLMNGVSFFYLGFEVSAFDGAGRSGSPAWRIHQYAIRFFLYHVNLRKRIDYLGILELFLMETRKVVMSIVRRLAFVR